MNYYISDLHLFHKNVTNEGSNFDNRPFDTLEEMHKVIKENWNSKITNADHVYILGDLAWKENEDGLVYLIIEWKGFYHWLAQKVFHRPKQSEIAMDALGSFVWKQLDGKRDMHEVAELVRQEFGKKADPVYERLIKFVEIMRDNKFVLLKEERKDA